MLLLMFSRTHAVTDSTHHDLPPYTEFAKNGLLFTKNSHWSAACILKKRWPSLTVVRCMVRIRNSRYPLACIIYYLRTLRHSSCTPIGDQQTWNRNALPMHFVKTLTERSATHKTLTEMYISGLRILTSRACYVHLDYRVSGMLGLCCSL